MARQQSIKPATKQPSAEARIAALEAQLRINSQLEESDIMKNEGESPREPAWVRNRGNPMVTCQALGGKYKEPS